MQLVPALTSNPRTIARETTAGTHLPYERHIDDTTIALRGGFLMRTIRLEGLLFETTDTDELNYRAELRDALLRAVGSPQLAIYHHVIRRKAEVALDARFPDAFSRDLDTRWKARLGTKEMYVNELFVTVIHRPLQGRLGLLDRMRAFVRTKAEDEAAFANSLRELDAATGAVLAALTGYEPHLLSAYDSPKGPRSEVLEFLSYLFNNRMVPCGLPYGDMGQHLAARRISFGQNAFELAPAGLEPRQFGAIVAIKDYPGHTLPGMFDQLYRMPFEMVVTQSFAFTDRGTSLGAMNLALRRMRSTEDDALSLRQELVQAKDDVAAGRAAFGEHHTVIALVAPSLGDLDARVAEVTAVLADLGIVAVREDIALEPAFWSQFPGNFGYIARPGLISTRNFAGLASLHNHAVGKAAGNHWGQAVSVLETTAAGPYFFSFHQNDLGNFTIIGPSGSGKTVVLNFLLAQARKFAPRIVFFDKDRGAELFIRAVGGQYDRLQPGAASGLNPLQLADTAINRQFLHDWIAMLAGGLDTVEAELVRDAITASYTLGPSARRLRHLAELLRGHDRPHPEDLYARLMPWWGDGERAWLFDNELDQVDIEAATTGFDMTAILDDSALRTPALFYLFHRVEERLDGTPAIIVVDEGWKALDDDVFVRRIKDWEKTIRKRNGIVGFATQSAQDALESRISSAIIEQAATQIFMPNPRARSEDYIDGFGLTPHEFDLVKTLPDSAHCFLVRHGNDSVVARLDLSGERDLLTILSGRESTVRLFDELVGRTGPDPASWMPALLERA